MTLADWLLKTGTSQYEFATRIGTSQATVNRYVKGTRVPRLSNLLKIRDATYGAVTANDFGDQIEEVE